MQTFQVLATRSTRTAVGWVSCGGTSGAEALAYTIKDISGCLTSCTLCQQRLKSCRHPHPNARFESVESVCPYKYRASVLSGDDKSKERQTIVNLQHVDKVADGLFLAHCLLSAKVGGEIKGTKAVDLAVHAATI